MFTGIIQGQGQILKIQKGHEKGSLFIHVSKSWKLKKGGSVSVNGVCLTVRDFKNNQAVFDCMPETFKVTNLGSLKKEDWVNLELPLTPRTQIGGHLVQGHVDGIGKILKIQKDGNSKIMTIQTPKKLTQYFIRKGSVAVDGVSLTITRIFAKGFEISLIPITLQETILGRKKAGDTVNLEVDMIAKYVERTIQSHGNV
jgi:riboflavin synthase